MTPANNGTRRFEYIVKHLEARMLDGTLATGDRLPSERELMAEYGVGRGSVREALFALQRMGLIVLSAGERAYVTRPSAKTLVREFSGVARQLLAAPDGPKHFQDARRMLESALARQAAMLATGDDLKYLHAAMEEHRLSKDRDRAIAADIAFHYRIAAIVGNPVLVALQDGLAEWLREQRATSVRVPGAKRAAAVAHRKIYDAISARDPEAAAEAIEHHLNEVETFYWSAVEALRAVPTKPPIAAKKPMRRKAVMTL